MRGKPGCLTILSNNVFDLLRRSTSMSMIRILVLACALSGFEPAQAADYPAPVEGDFVLRDFQFSDGETLPELKIHYRTLGHAAEGRQGHRAQCRAHRPWHRRQRCAIHPSGIRRRVVWRGTAAGRDPLLHRAGRRHRARQIRQTQRWTAREVSAVRLHRHGRSAVPPAHRGPCGQSPAAGHGHVHGRHAHLGVGRAPSGIHGRADAAGQPSGADLRPQPRLAQDDHRCHPQRSGLARRQLHRAATVVEHRGLAHLLHGQQSHPAPGADAHARQGG